MAHLAKDAYSHIHYDGEQARSISVREAARLQSFPDGFRFEGNMGDCFRQSATPFLLALVGDRRALAGGAGVSVQASEASAERLVAIAIQPATCWFAVSPKWGQSRRPHAVAATLLPWNHHLRGCSWAYSSW